MNKLLSLVFLLTLLSATIWYKNSEEPNLENYINPIIKSNLIPVNISFAKITLDSVFNKKYKFQGRNIADLITIIATGDIIPARSVNYQSVTRNNFKWAFERTADVIRKADITLINLESPLTKNCSVTNSGMVFCGREDHIEGLLYAGIDIANLANNHSQNYGEDGIKNTKDLLNKNGILAAGINGPVYKVIKGVNFAFLGYNDIAGGYIADINQIKTEIIDAKGKADVVIVSFHFGDEYKTQPNNRQKELAHLAIDAGADLIIGNHPHWIQPVEIYKEKFITYAHGNFIFDQMWSEKTKEGVVGKYTFSGKNLVDVEFIPIKIANYGQAYFLTGSEKERILNELKTESINLSSKNP